MYGRLYMNRKNMGGKYHHQSRERTVEQHPTRTVADNKLQQLTCLSRKHITIEDGRKDIAKDFSHINKQQKGRFSQIFFMFSDRKQLGVNNSSYLGSLFYKSAVRITYFCSCYAHQQYVGGDLTQSEDFVGCLVFTL